MFTVSPSYERCLVGWQVDWPEIDVVVGMAFDRSNVVGRYVAPAHLQDCFDRWQVEFGARPRVRATVARPFEWWTNRAWLMVALWSGSTRRSLRPR